ncbi:5'-nucleotidase [Neisseria maigaei]|uniref:5'-nucleotidase n=1 Tax=Neisseria maigaei TaxID=2830651 RepID=UPI00265B6AD3|nr:5'-nucleotidase [Neisseria maigaei]
MPSENIFRRHYRIRSSFQIRNVHPYTIFATMPHKSTAKDILIMSYDLPKRLVIGLASSALFDLSESDNIFRIEGAETYRQYQREKQNHPLKKALSFHLSKTLSINEINPNDPPIGFILLSGNNPDTDYGS